MISATQPAKRRRWFRFSLRTLLIVVALAAVASWAYWIGWPWWVIHREQARFEQTVKQITAGSIGADVFIRVRFHNPPPYALASTSGYSMTRYEWPNAVYYVFLKVPPTDTFEPSSGPILSIEVFRLPQPPYDYVPQTESGKSGVKYNKLTPQSPNHEFAKMAYFFDFLSFVLGDRNNNPGFQYELIYSDPPQDDKPH